MVSELGSQVVEYSSSHCGCHGGGGQGPPLAKHEGGTGYTALPPGGREQCAFAAMAFTTPPQGSPCEVSVQFCCPTHVACA